MNETDENKIAISNVTKRNAKSRLIFLLSFLGNILCIALVIARQREIIFVSDSILYIALFAMLICLLFLSWVWHEGMDEFEKSAIGNASFWGLSAGSITLPWILLHDIEMAPHPNAMYIVGFMFLITIAYYYYQKFFGCRISKNVATEDRG